MPASESTVSTRGNGGGNEVASSNESKGTAYSAKGWDRAKRAAEEESFAEWLRRYSAGTIGPSDQMPKPPPAVLAILREREAGYDVPSTNGSSSTTASFQLDAVPRLFKEDPVSSSGNLSQGSSEQSSVGSEASTSATSHSNASVSDAEAAALLEHFRRYGTFPAPPGPWEEERLKLTRKYGLDQSTRRKAVDRICAIAKAYFKTETVVISLTFDDFHVLGGERGFDPDGEPALEDPVRRLEIEPSSFCAHAMASSYSDPTAVFVVANANNDWRFERNPYATKMGGGISFYAAANINLPVGIGASKRGVPNTLTSGAICLMDPTRSMTDESEFSQEDRAMLSDLAEMIAREFQLGFEQRRREAESKQSEFLGSFLRQALIQPIALERLPSEDSNIHARTTSLRQAPSSVINESNRDSTTVVLQEQALHVPPSPSLPKSSSSQQSQSSGTRHSSLPCDLDSPSSPPSGSNPDLYPVDPPPPPAPSLFAIAAKNLLLLTRARSCGILDLRAFRSSHYHSQADILRPNTSMSPSQTSHPRSPFSPPLDSTPYSTRDPSAPSTRSRTSSYGVGPGKETRGKIWLMASEGEVEWADIVNMDAIHAKERNERTNSRSRGNGVTGVGEEDDYEGALTSAVEETLRIWSSMTTDELETQGLEGAFGAFGILPDSTTDTCCVPILDVDGTPALMIVLSSTEKWFGFEPTDRSFVQSVGAIIVGSLLRERARDGDRAKLAFISQVSHELRTPLHGINSQLELIREVSSATELRKITPLLDVADVCLESLSDVLNDTLDFSKLSHNTAHEDAALQRRNLTQIDLSALIEGVLKTTWDRKRRLDSATADLGSALKVEGQGKVDLILEVKDKEDGWEVMADIGGMKRVLLNIIGNAIKFTKRGHVKVTLRFLGRSSVTTPDVITPRPQQLSPDQRTYRGYVVIAVQDTGIGMTQEFLRDGSLFTPFRQADSFSSGAGLGLSICDSIVKGLGPGRIDVTSELGAGSEISVTLPLDFVYKPSPNSFPFTLDFQNASRLTSRRIISDELDALLGPLSQMLPSDLVPQPVPPSPTSLTLSSQPIERSLHPPEVVSQQAVAAVQVSITTPVQDDLATEVAELAIASSEEVDSSLLPISSPLSTTKTHEDQAQLNAKMEEEAAADARQRNVPEQRKASVAPDVHVLFADDNPVARNILVKLFTVKGIKFSAAEDGQQAVDLFNAAGGSFNLMFLDVQMPIKDGIEATHDMRVIENEQGWHRSRILALTGLSNESDMAKGLGQGGVDKWLVKGGKSLRLIIEEVVEMQKEVAERRLCEEA